VAIALRGLGPRRSGFLTALLLENGAFSLGKLQFYAWTAAAVFGYLFLAFARSLVQWRFELPEVPEGLPGIVGISAGTSVAAAAIGALSATRGPAGTKPSLADLIVTGGTVIVDRVQFLVWTIVAIVAFLAVVLTADPARIDTLPIIPNGLLYLMGLSAAGYLGGKFVRRPSPSLQTIAATDDAANKKLSLVLKGRNLSKNASFRINDVAIAPKAHGIRPFHDDIIATTPESGFSDELFQQISFAVEYDTPLVNSSGANRLVVINSDGQSAPGEIVLNQPTPPALAAAAPPAVPIVGAVTGVWQRPLI
jgi:hypothetical protein